MGFIRITLSLALLSLWLSSPASSRALPESLDPRAGEHWVDTWTSMPQLVETSNLPPSPFLSSSSVFKDATLRQTLHVSIPTTRLRIQISNTFGTTDLPITSASIALPTSGKAGSAGIQTSTLAALTFSGKSSVTIPKGTVMYTDAIDFKVGAMSMVTVTLYSQAGQSGNSITGHPGSRTTSWMQSGNHVNDTSLSGTSTKHWYFVSGIESWAPADSSAWVILGDSLTDGRGSDDDTNDRWPDLVLARLQKGVSTINIGVNNQAAGGNRVLADGLGPSLISRYTRDAITQSGAKYILIFEGVNDIGSASTDSSTQTSIGDQLFSAFTKIATDAHKNGIAVFGATITPFCAPSVSQQSYTDPTREKTRQRVNAWIKGTAVTSGLYDAVVDFDAVVRDPNTVSQLVSKYNGGDYLHPNEAGYQALADAFPLDVFEKFANISAH